MINIQLVVGRKVHRRDNDDTEAPEPDQTQIPSHPGIKYSARGIPHSDIQNILDRGNPIKLININGNLWKWGCPKDTKVMTTLCEKHVCKQMFNHRYLCFLLDVQCVCKNMSIIPRGWLPDKALTQGCSDRKETV